MLNKFIEAIWQLDGADSGSADLARNGTGQEALLRRRLEYTFLQELKLPCAPWQPGELAASVHGQLRKDRHGRSVFDWVWLLANGVTYLLDSWSSAEPPWLLRTYELGRTRWALKTDGFDDGLLIRCVEDSQNISLFTLPLGEMLVLDWAQTEFLGCCGSVEGRNTIVSWLMGWSQAAYGLTGRAEMLCEMFAFVFGLPSRVCQPENSLREILSWGLPQDRLGFRCSFDYRMRIVGRMLGLLYGIRPHGMANRFRTCEKKDVSVREWSGQYLDCFEPRVMWLRE